MRQLLFLAALLCGCAGEPHTDAVAEINAWVRAHYGDSLRGEPEIFYGDFTGDGARDALVWVMYNDGGLHNFGEASLFRSTAAHMTFWRTDGDASGEDPRAIRIQPGRITLTTTVLQDGDARCCPTGHRRWTIRTN